MKGLRLLQDPICHWYLCLDRGLELFTNPSHSSYLQSSDLRLHLWINLYWRFLPRVWFLWQSWPKYINILVKRQWHGIIPPGWFLLAWSIQIGVVNCARFFTSSSNFSHAYVAEVLLLGSVRHNLMCHHRVGFPSQFSILSILYFLLLLLRDVWRHGRSWILVLVVDGNRNRACFFFRLKLVNVIRYFFGWFVTLSHLYANLRFYSGVDILKVTLPRLREALHFRRSGLYHYSLLHDRGMRASRHISPNSGIHTMDTWA